MIPAELSELITLERLIDQGAPLLQARVACEVPVHDRRLPVYALTLGNPDPACPAIGFFGGVHGLERIGAEVVLAYLASLVTRLRWDTTLHRQLESLRMVFMPIVNPGGLWQGTRSNPQGVDLMRNAPVQAVDPPLWGVGGQRLGPWLPWYRGAAGQPMQAEAQAVCALVQAELLPRRFSLVVDCHSGFGLTDRVWFPFAHTRQPIHHLAEVYALKQIFDQSLLHHRYVFEPQSRQYLTHGDLWDHLYLLSRAGQAAQSAAPADGATRTFLPLTLEMGSWLWVKKNPRQLFSRHGIFNPLIEHRQQRVLRRHLPWLDFLTRAASSHGRWAPLPDQRPLLHEQALDHWYRRPVVGGRR